MMTLECVCTLLSVPELKAYSDLSKQATFTQTHCTLWHISLTVFRLLQASQTWTFFGTSAVKKEKKFHSVTTIGALLFHSAALSICSHDTANQMKSFLGLLGCLLLNYTILRLHFQFRVWLERVYDWFLWAPAGAFRLVVWCHSLNQFVNVCHFTHMKKKSVFTLLMEQIDTICRLLVIWKFLSRYLACSLNQMLKRTFWRNFKILTFLKDPRKMALSKCTMTNYITSSVCSIKYLIILIIHLLYYI